MTDKVTEGSERKRAQCLRAVNEGDFISTMTVKDFFEQILFFQRQSLENRNISLNMHDLNDLLMNIHYCGFIHNCGSINSN